MRPKTAGATGQVEVRLDSPTATPVSPNPFDNINGMDIISSGTNTNFTFYDVVPAAQKPASDGTNDGIKVQSGSGGTLEIDAGTADTTIELTASTTTSGEVRVTDADSDPPAFSRWSGGITKLTLRANDAGFATVNAGGVGLPDTVTLDVETGSGTHDNINLDLGDNQSLHNSIVHTGAGDDVVFVGAGDQDGDGSVIATVDFTSDSLDSGNQLSLFGPATVTLAHTSASEIPIAVDLVKVQSEGDTAILHVTDAAVIGDLQLIGDQDGAPSTETAIIDAPTTISTFECQYGGTVLIEASCGIGALSFVAPFAEGQTNPTLVEYTGTSGPSSVGSISDPVGESIFTLDSDANVTIKTSSRIGTLNIDGGALLTLQPRAVLPTSAHARLLTVTSLDLGTDSGGDPLGTLDIKDNDLIIKSGSVGTWNGTAYTGLTGILTHAYGSSASWNGTGITTSMSDAIDPQNLTSIGIALASDVAGDGVWRQGGSYNVTVDSTDVLIKYTYKGDANLDGAITGDDYFQIDSAFPSQIVGWLNGDFNFDGAITGDDYFAIDSNFPEQGAPL